MNRRRPKTDARTTSFILGMFLGIIGLLIAVIIYSGSKYDFEEDPTAYAAMWSLFGMVIWIVVIAALFLFSIGLSVSPY